MAENIDRAALVDLLREAIGELGPCAVVTAVDGDNQIGLLSKTVNLPPAVLVEGDAGARPVECKVQPPAPAAAVATCAANRPHRDRRCSCARSVTAMTMGVSTEAAVRETISCTSAAVSTAVAACGGGGSGEEAPPPPLQDLRPMR